MNLFLSYDEFSCLQIHRISLYHPALFTCIDLTTIAKVMKLCSCHVRWMHFCKILCLNPTFMTLACSNSVQVRHKYLYLFYPLLVYLWKAGKLVHAIRYNNCIQILMILIKISQSAYYVYNTSKCIWFMIHIPLKSNLHSSYNYHELHKF